MTKQFRLTADQITPLAEGYGGCIATDKITVEGYPVRLMYREAPVEAAKLQKISHALSKSKNLKLDASAKEPETYIRLLSMHEVGLDQCEKELRRIVHAIAWKHGVITRLKPWLHQRKVSKSLPGNTEFLVDFSKETMSGIGKNY